MVVRVLLCGLKGEFVLVGWLEMGEGSVEFGLDMLCFDVVDCVWLVIGIMRLFIFWEFFVWLFVDKGWGISLLGGILLVVGIGRLCVVVII